MPDYANREIDFCESGSLIQDIQPFNNFSSVVKSLKTTDLDMLWVIRSLKYDE